MVFFERPRSRLMKPRKASMSFANASGARLWSGARGRELFMALTLEETLFRTKRRMMNAGAARSLPAQTDSLEAASSLARFEARAARGLPCDRRHSQNKIRRARGRIAQYCRRRGGGT